MDLLLELVSSELRYVSCHSFSEASVLELGNLYCNHATDRFCMSFKNSLAEDYSKVGEGGFSSLEQRSLKSLQLTDSLLLLETLFGL